MPAKAGTETNAIIKVATTWGTAVAGGAGSKVAAEITPSVSVGTLTSRELGTGNEMATSVTKGQQDVSLGLAMDVGNNNGFPNVLAAFMGTAPSPGTEVTAGQGDFKHTITFNSTINVKPLTIAFDDSTTTTQEFPSCAVTDITIKPKSVPGFIDFTASLIANDLILTSVVNTTAALAAATVGTNNELLAINVDDDVWINAQSGGALSSSNQFNVTNWELKLTRPQKTVNELKGSGTGAGAPGKDGYFTGTLTIQRKELADHAEHTIWTNETAQKCKLLVEGTQIGTGTNKSLAVYIPSMKMVEAPTYQLTAPGINTVTIKYEIIKASANPTGMSNTYPHFEIVNQLSTSLLA